MTSPTPDTRHPTPVLITGIAVADAIARTIDRMPEPGGLRFFDSLSFATGGNAVSCSIALARLGVGATIVARVGRTGDPLGDLIERELVNAGVDTAGLRRDPDRSTSFSFVSVFPGGERSFLHTTGANATLAASDITPALLAGRRFVFVTGAMLMDALDGEPTADVLRRARAAGAATLLDTVYVEGIPVEEWRRRVFPALPLLDYFIPSEPEAAVLSGESAPERMALAFIDRGVRHAVIKLGARGVLCMDATSRRATIVPACRVPKVVDATGAGDCWAAGFIAGLHAGEPIAAAARLGNAVAGVAIQSAGATTGLRDMNQVQEFLRAQP